MDPRHNASEGAFQETPEERRARRSINFLGYEIRKKADDNSDEEIIKSFAPPQEETESAHTIISRGGGITTAVVDVRNDTFTNEADLISKYRQMAQQPEVDRAIGDIADEAIVSNGHDMPVTINLDSVDGTDRFKEKITEEFDGIMTLLDFRKYGHDIFKRWYIDGKLVYANIIDNNNPSAGLKEIRPINPYKIRRIRELTTEPDKRTGINLITGFEEYFVYSEQGFTGNTGHSSHNVDATQGVKVPTDSITFVSSGMLDANRNVTLSYLHKAMRPVNQLRMMEDALITYRVARSSERRIFNVAVGQMNSKSAESYVNRLMNKFKNKVVYNPTTGEVTSDRHHMNIMEDYWFAKTSDGKGTDVTTLQGGQNLSQIDDVEYFKLQLYKSLNVPVGRLDNESGFSIGRAHEISRDEIRFQKHIDHLRMRFSDLFKQILKQQLILKSIIKENEWDSLKEHLFFDYAQDTFFSELKEAEIRRERISAAKEAEDLVGTYFSKEYIRKEILMQNEEEIKEIKHQIRTEAMYKDGLPDPEGDLEGGGEGGFEGDLGDLDGEGLEGEDAFGDPDGAALELGADGDEFDDIEGFDDQEDLT